MTVETKETKEKIIRTRIAPSPTGEFHIGGMRGVLYNYAFAKNNGGKFVLRIEDTDRNRLVEGATERLLEVIKDYGLEWDEGPFVQSERSDIYSEYAVKLVDSGAAYPCFCSKERLSELRKDQQAKGFPVTKYDKKCSLLSKEEAAERVSAEESHVIRLNVPKNEDITFNDAVLGDITINTKDIDDQVLMKSDGFPTYHLAVVIDDHLMKITHIMRGMEWLPSTPKHVLLYRAFGWELPVYVHLPLLKEKDSNKKLSKRSGDVHAIAFLEMGYLPEALLNFLMFLGWNPGTEKEIYSLDEFVKDFSIERLQKTDLVSFDRDKLLWINGQYIRNFSVEELHKKILKWAKEFSVELPEEFKTDGNHILGLIQGRLKVFTEVPELIKYFYTEPQIEKTLLTKFAKEEDRAKQIISNFIEMLTETNDWSVENLDKISHDLIQEKEYKPKEAFMTLRVAISGVTATPPLFDTLGVLGKETVLQRLNKALNL